MYININFKSKTPIYLQLRNQIVKGIAKGELEEGETLPSVRRMAKDIGINMHTVNKSYKVLENQGFVSIHKRKGVQVNSWEEMHHQDFIVELNKRLETLISEAFCRGLSKEDISKTIGELYQKFSRGIND